MIIVVVDSGRGGVEPVLRYKPSQQKSNGYFVRPRPRHAADRPKERGRRS